MKQTEEGYGVVEQMLNRIFDLKVQQHEMDWEIRNNVTWLRQEGATWTQIGESLGVSRQAAHEAYGHKKPPEVNPGQTMIAID